MGSLDSSKNRGSRPDINITEFPDLGEGGAENPSITDGEHVILECRHCNAPLVDVWVTSPEVVMVSRIQASCGHCDNKSFIKTVHGKFYVGETDYSLVSSVQYNNIETDEIDRSIVLSQDVLLSTVKIKDYV